MATIGETLAAAFAKYDPQRVVPNRKLTNEDHWRAKLANQGEISKAPTTLGSLLGDAISGAAKKVGASDRAAQRVSKRATAFLNDATPVGNALMAEEGGKQVKRGLTRGDLKQAAIGAGVFGLSMLPFAGKAKKPLNSLMYDEEGAIRAWHGSPHDFDKFSLDKIGTGEGAQAYGHGLYFAEAKDVAEEYQRKLAPTSVKFRGKDLNEPRAWWSAKDELEAAGDWRTGKALDELHSWGRQGYDTETSLRYLRNEHRNSPEMLEAIERLAGDVQMAKAPGRLYEVNINAEPEDFLDWDAAIGGAIRGDYGGAKQYTGASLVSALERIHGGRARASDALRGLSLPGLKYLDQGSRGSGVGTRNYVVFDDALVDILNKY
jgi:hypothetical protein